MSTITHRCSFWLIRNAFWELWRSSTLTPLPEELQSDLGKRAPCWGVGCCDFSRSRFKFSHTVRKLGCVLRGIFKARVVTSSPTLAPKSSRFSKNSTLYHPTPVFTLHAQFIHQKVGIVLFPPMWLSVLVQLSVPIQSVAPQSQLWLWRDWEREWFCQLIGYMLQYIHRYVFVCRTLDMTHRKTHVWL